MASLPQVQGKNNSKLIPSGLFFEWWQPQMYKGPLADVKVRRALMYAFDRKKDNQIAWAGKGIDTWNPFQKTPYYIGKPWPVSYDPDRAKSELAKARSAQAQAQHDDPAGAGALASRVPGAAAGLLEGGYQRVDPDAALGPVVRPPVHQAEP